MSECNRCTERLEEGFSPSECCPVRCAPSTLALYKRWLKSMATQDLLPGMPNPKENQPALVFKAQAERKTLIPYDPEKGLALLGGKRGDFASLYDDKGEVTDIFEGLIHCG